MDEKAIFSPFFELAEKAFSKEENPSKKTHYINLLQTGDEALLARIHLIRSARKSVVLQTYIWIYDEVGRYMCYELLKAARRGVKVRLIIDQFVDAVGKANVEFLSFMAGSDPNLEVQYYNPVKKVIPSYFDMAEGILKDFKKLNQRMHNKIVVVDDSIGITGGRNYENDYYDRGLTRSFRDRDVLVIGPEVKDMSASFEEYWKSELTVPIGDFIEIKEIIEKGEVRKVESREDFHLGDYFDETDTLASDSNAINEKFIKNTFKVAKVRFVADKPGKSSMKNLKEGSLTGFELDNFLSQARKRVLLQSPYLVFDKIALDKIKKIKKYKPDIDVLISSNSLAATDNLYAYSFAYKLRKQLVKNFHFRLFELKPVAKDIGSMLPRYEIQKKKLQLEKEKFPDKEFSHKKNHFEYPDVHMCIHAKSFVVDDDMVWIGSFNLDPRSVHLNTEVGLMIWDEKVAAALSKNMLRDMAPQNSWTIGKPQQVALRSFFTWISSKMITLAKVVNFWPFRYAHCFELKEEKEPLPFYHKDFYENYYSVGVYPEVKENTREIEMGLIKNFAGFMEPIV